MSSAIFDESLFPMWQEKFHHVTPAYSVQSLQAQKCCKISCKEGMLHAAIYVQLVSQPHCEISCREGMLHAAIYLQLVSQPHCEISCREGMLHTVIYLLLVSQPLCEIGLRDKFQRGNVTRCNLPAACLATLLRDWVAR